VDALLAALEVQVAVGQRVEPSELALASPCPGWSVRDVLVHSLAVTTKFTDFAAGHADRPRTPGGDLVGPDHRVALRTVAAAATEAWRAADLSRSCHLPFGTFGAADAAGINAFDVLGHTWDMAEATGQCVECPDELWAAGLDAARRVIGPDRDHAHYSPEVPTPGDATPMVQFLAYLGRGPAQP
jgi:uncharacterized protein (TIGR03086 family)